MQRLARGVGAGVQILKLFPRFSMGNFKNRLTTKKSETVATAGPPGPQTLEYRRLTEARASARPPPLPALWLPPLYIYPPGPMQRLARGIGAGVQILKLLSRFSMGKFKNRLTDTKGPQTTPRRPPGPHPPYRRLRDPLRRPLRPCRLPREPKASTSRCVPGSSCVPGSVAYPAASNPSCVPGSPWVRTRQCVPGSLRTRQYPTPGTYPAVLAYPAAPNPRCVPGSAYPAALRTRQLLGVYPAACVPGSTQPQVRTRQLPTPGAYPAALRTRQSKKKDWIVCILPNGFSPSVKLITTTSRTKLSIVDYNILTQILIIPTSNFIKR